MKTQNLVILAALTFGAFYFINQSKKGGVVPVGNGGVSPDIPLGQGVTPTIGAPHHLRSRRPELVGKAHIIA